jgi:hypothetical protein
LYEKKQGEESRELVFGQEDCLHLNVWSPPPPPRRVEASGGGPRARGERGGEEAARARGGEGNTSTSGRAGDVGGGGTEGNEREQNDEDASEERGLSPVFVWIHGGAFVLGDGFQEGLYDGGKLARDAGAVVVTINYRLGALGFLTHEGLDDDDEGLDDDDDDGEVYGRGGDEDEGGRGAPAAAGARAGGAGSAGAPGINRNHHGGEGHGVDERDRHNRGGRRRRGAGGEVRINRSTYQVKPFYPSSATVLPMK